MESVARDLVKALWLELVTFRTNHSLQLGGEQLEVSLVMTRHLENKLEMFEPEISRNWDFLGCKLMIGLDWMKGKSEQEIMFFLGEVNGVSG